MKIIDIRKRGLKNEIADLRGQKSRGFTEFTKWESIDERIERLSKITKESTFSGWAKYHLNLKYFNPADDEIFCIEASNENQFKNLIKEHERKRKKSGIKEVQIVNLIRFRPKNRQITMF